MLRISVSFASLLHQSKGQGGESILSSSA